MNEEIQKSAEQSGTMFFLLFLTFMVLKLCNVIDWSWWWITCPLWGMTAVIFAFVLLFLIVYGFVYFVVWIKNNLT